MPTTRGQQAQDERPWTQPAKGLSSVPEQVGGTELLAAEHDRRWGLHGAAQRALQLGPIVELAVDLAPKAVALILGEIPARYVVVHAGLEPKETGEQALHLVRLDEAIPLVLLGMFEITVRHICDSLSCACVKKPNF